MSLMLWSEAFSHLDPFFNQPQNKASISNEEKEISIEIEAPGMKADDVLVSVDRGTLSIKGENRTRRGSRSFSKNYILPEEVDENAVEAKLQDGILTVLLPKKEIPAAKRISVRTV